MAPKGSETLSKLLEQVLSQPTAPFRESWVKRAALAFCAEHGFKTFEDDAGNLWVNANSMRELKHKSLVFVAHLDHPGIVLESFEQSRQGKIKARGRWLGGGPVRLRNFPVKIFSDASALMILDGVITRHTVGARSADAIEIEIKPTSLSRSVCTNRGFKELGLWGACLWYSQPHGIELKKGLWVTKAADDLAGVCALLEGLRRARLPRSVALLLSRAEESGFHGSLHVLEKQMLNPARTAMISIEASSWLKGAELGKGPVVRLGDRATVFNSSLVQWVSDQAAELAKQDKNFRFQRRLMDGGTCEATAFNCYRFKTAGISIPLQNYHNLSSSGRPLPEAVHRDDVEGLVRLIAQLMSNFKMRSPKTFDDSAFRPFLKRLLKNHRLHQRYFKH